MFICEDISFDIDGQKLFTNINLNLKPQKDLLITGPSGVGKTTLLSILCGIQKPATGKVTYNNINIYDLAENKIDDFRGKNLGIVFQNFNLINSFTVKQNLEIAASAIDKQNSNLFFDLLDRVGLADKSHLKVLNLSIGEKQRLAVARAFVGEPQWIFCDEPTSSLDDKNANIIANLIKEETSRCEASLVLITHDSRIQTLINFSKILRLGEEL